MNTSSKKAALALSFALAACTQAAPVEEEGSSESHLSATGKVCNIEGTATAPYGPTADWSHKDFKEFTNILDPNQCGQICADWNAQACQWRTWSSKTPSCLAIYSGIYYDNLTKPQFPVGTTILGSATCQVAPSNELLNGAVFDAGYYMSIYSDLAGHDGAWAANHWLTYGADEGRRASPEFHSVVYLSNYPDVAAAYGPTNYKAAAIHYVQYGKAEGRSGN